MARMGRFDTRGLKDFQRKLEKISQSEIDAFLEDCAKELAGRLLRMVVKRTPVGDYSHEVTVTAKRDGKKHKKGEQYTKRVNTSGRRGGTLRRGWTGGQRYSKDYVDSLEVRHEAGRYIIEITNQVEWASYVEFGHRQTPGRYVPDLGKQLKQKWVPGKFMMTISERDLRDIAPKVLENKLKKFLGGVFHD